MKPRWRAAALAWCVALLLAVFLGGSAFVIANLETLGPRNASQHITQARVWTGTPGSFEAPSRLRGAVAPDTTGELQALPYRWPRTSPGPGTAAGTTLTWLRLDIDPALRARAGTSTDPAHHTLHLYLPRWQTAGRITVYGDEQLLFQSRGDIAWNGFNHPLWIPLRGGAPAAPPATVWLRIDSLSAAGGAVSSAWIGPEDALAARYLLRRQLQTGGPEVLNMAALGLGAFALLVWLRRRHERTYLLFAAFTLLWVLRGLRYHVGLEPLPIPPAWFTWLTVVSGNAVVLAWYLFVATLVPAAPRWPARVLASVVLLSALAALPGLHGPVGSALLAPLSYWATNVVGTSANLLMAWYAWRHGGQEGRVAAAIGLLHLPVALHDSMLLNNVLSPEHLYAWPVSTVARMLMFIYVIASRYLGALRTAEAANLRLAEQLRAREAALAASEAQLRLAQETQALAQERQRLMQDIHDGMGSQLMSALKVAESGPLDDARMAQVLRDCLDDLTLTVDALETVDADLLLLLATLRYRLDQRLGGSGIRIRWEVSDLPPLAWLDAHGALHILRILQEGIANVLQHAQATELRVTTGESDGGVYVALDHNGKGPEPALAGNTRPVGGKGLSNMQRRAAALGALVEHATLAEGARLRVWLPLHRGQRLERHAHERG